jgi:hypothetical protein
MDLGPRSFGLLHLHLPVDFLRTPDFPLRTFMDAGPRTHGLLYRDNLLQFVTRQ